MRSSQENLEVLKNYRAHQLELLKKTLAARKTNKGLRNACRGILALIRALDEAIASLAVIESQVLLLEALQFYADPETYFAIGFFSDAPYGEFMEDFSDTEVGHKPGKQAREALDKIATLVRTTTSH